MYLVRGPGLPCLFGKLSEELMSAAHKIFSKSDVWLTRAPKQGARRRLFCFPFGGGGASFYRTWRNGFGNDVEVCAVQLPGRENRLRERAFTHLAPLVASLMENLGPYLDIPFAFFGHSVGALVAFEFARRLERETRNRPMHLFVSARRAPQLVNNRLARHKMPEAQFMDEVRRYKGTPELLFQEPELLEIFLPILRSDFSILETYEYSQGDILDCPITVFGGTEDTEATVEDLLAWREQTRGEFRLKMFPGDHFYLKIAHDQLLLEIAKDMERHNQL